jgi:hypothetical protein
MQICHVVTALAPLTVSSVFFDLCEFKYLRLLSAGIADGTVTKANTSLFLGGNKTFYFSKRPLRSPNFLFSWYPVGRGGGYLREGKVA